MSSVELRIEGGVAQLALNRPEKRNALDRDTIEGLTRGLKQCAEDDKIRVIKITGTGAVFCAGADLAEMQAQADASESDNLAHARKLSELLGFLYEMPKPTLARVNGDGYGGALGLIGACDVVVAVDSAKFAFTEVRLGIVPAVISPFVVGKMGEAKALRYFLTADTLSASDLKSVGLAHEVVSAGALDTACKLLEQSLLKGAPGALSAAKALIRDVAHGLPAERAAASKEMAARLAKLRVQPEAQEGFKAFFEKRKPIWRAD
ncbi:MAG TPA: enoyl-CoA hydratase-related protein [Steroidobacteraceae bacterium]